MYISEISKADRDRRTATIAGLTMAIRVKEVKKNVKRYLRGIQKVKKDSKIITVACGLMINESRVLVFTMAIRVTQVGKR